MQNNKKNILINNMLIRMFYVLEAGIEPARPLLATGF